jgi:SAM-dependent MidA family methyltransferase
LDLSQYPDGYRTEVNLEVLPWLQRVSDRLRQGYLLTIDYGYPAHRYYSPARSAGTLQCYYQHAHHSNPYLHLGQQDLTAHVNFTALEHWGKRVGLNSFSVVAQGLFLMALGLGDRLAAISQETEPLTPQQVQYRLQKRQALHALIDPLGMGNFGVVIQGKGLSVHQCQTPIKGLKGNL